MPVTVIDIIKPKNAQPFPIVEDAEFLGGFRTVADHTERDAVPSERRKLGMWVYTRSDGKVWTLVGGLLNANWTEVAFGGGGGGGTKIYADESVLLATADPAGTLAYAADKGNFWFRRASTWQRIPNPHVVRRETGPYQITVDPVLGDDSEWNDGKTTPLKTLDALFARLPVADHQATAGVADVATAPVVRVLLKGGAHSFGAAGEWLPIDLSNVFFYGEASDLHTFAIDSYSDGDMVVHQAPGNPAWVVDEHVGRVLRVSIDYGPPWGVYTYEYFIIANTTHSLTVNWGTGAPTYIPIGTSVTIAEMTSRIVGPATFLLQGTNGARFASGFVRVIFDTSVNALPYMFDVYASATSFTNCLFKGDGAAKMMYVEEPGATVRFDNCMFLNLQSAIVPYGGSLFFQTITAANCGFVIETRFHTTTDIRQSLVLRNVSYLYWSDRGGEVWYIYGDAIYCINTDYMFFHAGQQSATIHAYGGYPTQIPGHAPKYWFGINPGCRVFLESWTQEASVATIQMNPWVWYGYPAVQFSAADLAALYGREFDYGFGAWIASV